MDTVEIVGIVSRETGEPYVMFDVLNATGESVTKFKLHPDEARELAQNILEAATNAVYESTIILWSQSVNNENPDIGIHLVSMIREYRQDRWGRSAQVEDSDE